MRDFRRIFSDYAAQPYVHCSVFFDEELSKHSTFRIGGVARVFALPEDELSLVYLLRVMRSENLRFFLVGGASNVVFPDGIYEGVIISTAKIGGIRAIPQKDGAVLLECAAGVSVSQLVRFCTENALSGLEEFAGLPGTVGGALFMNARCFEKEVSQVFVSARILNMDDFVVSSMNYIQKQWGYKVSPFQNSDRIILTAQLKVRSDGGTSAQIEERCKSFIEQRKSKGHFDFPSAGSVFRNNHKFGAPSGKIIDDCGLKGLTQGGAQVAPFHGNIIINKGNATQNDVKLLTKKIIEEVKSKTGFTLQPEIIFIDK